MYTKQQFEGAVNTEMIVPEKDELAAHGFTTKEIVSLLWLRQWYQIGGSDRVPIVRHLEFLKLLVLNGKLEAHEVFVLSKREIQEFQRYLVLEIEMLRQVDISIAALPEFAKQQVVPHLHSTQGSSYGTRFCESLFHSSPSLFLFLLLSSVATASAPVMTEK